MHYFNEERNSNKSRHYLNPASQTEINTSHPTTSA